MKYPKSFTLVDRGNGVMVDMEYDSASDTYLADYGSGKAISYSEELVDDLIEEYYDVVKAATPTFADTLSFYHDTTTQQYNLQRIGNHSVVPLWACSQDGDKFRGATYTAEEIAEHFEKGDWKLVGEASKESVTKERELVFPFTVEVKDDSTYYVYKDSEAKLWMEDVHSGWKSTTPNLFSDKGVSELIKKGTWIVKSVGPQKTPETPTSASSVLPKPTRPAPPMPAVKPYKGAVEVSKQTVGHVSSLSIKLDSEGVAETTENFERLAQAVENVNVALESFASIIKSLDVNVAV
jgi:hypothetical protein